MKKLDQNKSINVHYANNIEVMWYSLESFDWFGLFVFPSFFLYNRDLLAEFTHSRVPFVIHRIVVVLFDFLCFFFCRPQRPKNQKKTSSSITNWLFLIHIWHLFFSPFVFLRICSIGFLYFFFLKICHFFLNLTIRQVIPWFDLFCFLYIYYVGCPSLSFSFFLFHVIQNSRWMVKPRGVPTKTHPVCVCLSNDACGSLPFHWWNVYKTTKCYKPHRNLALVFPFLFFFLIFCWSSSSSDIPAPRPT